MTRYQLSGLLVLLLLNVGSLPATAQQANCANSWQDLQTKKWECLDEKFAKSSAALNSKATAAELQLKSAKVTKISSNRNQYQVSGQFTNPGNATRFLSYAIINLDYSGTPFQQFIVPINASVAAGKSVSFSKTTIMENLPDLDPAMIKTTAIKYEYR